MKNILKIQLALAALLVLPLLSLAESFDSKSIYGADNRKEYFQLDASQKALADSTVSLWKSASVTAEGSGFKLKTVNFGDRLNLCPDVKFREQPIGAFCSGSLVGDDMIMTAGHCIKSDAQCADTKIVFDFNVKREGGQATDLQPAANVYSCKSIVKRFLAGEPNSANPTGQNLGPDYALIKLDRKVAGRKPLPINRGAKLKKGDAIFVVGHPVGLPLKLADDSTVRDFSKVGYFVANLDTFGGNSGSPVFNARTKKIEGILVRGDEDFGQSPAGCTTMATYDQNGGRGEDVTKIEVLASFIPKLAGEKSAPAELEVRDMDSSAIQPGEAVSKTVSFE